MEPNRLGLWQSICYVSRQAIATGFWEGLEKRSMSLRLLKLVQSLTATTTLRLKS